MFACGSRRVAERGEYSSRFVTNGNNTTKTKRSSKSRGNTGEKLILRFCFATLTVATSCSSNIKSRELGSQTLVFCGKSHDTISQLSGDQNGFEVNLYTNSKVGDVAMAGGRSLFPQHFHKNKKIAKSDILLLLRIRECPFMYLGPSCHARGRTVTCRMLVFRRNDANTRVHVRGRNCSGCNLRCQHPRAVAVGACLVSTHVSPQIQNQYTQNLH